MLLKLYVYVSLYLFYFASSIYAFALSDLLSVFFVYDIYDTQPIDVLWLVSFSPWFNRENTP
jgi:hypothetical protein